MYLLFSILISLSVFSQSFFGDGLSLKYVEISASITGKKNETIGNVDYKYPSHLRIEILRPHLAAFVTNKNQAWHYQSPVIETEKGHVRISKGGNFPQLLKIFDSLHTGLKINETYEYSNDGREISLVIKEKMKKEFGLEKILLKSSKGTKDLKKLEEVEELVINQTDKKVKTMKFLEFKDDVNFWKDHFIFQIPKNTKRMI